MSDSRKRKVAQTRCTFDMFDTFDCSLARSDRHNPGQSDRPQAVDVALMATYVLTRGMRPEEHFLIKIRGPDGLLPQGTENGENSLLIYSWSVALHARGVETRCYYVQLSEVSSGVTSRHVAVEMYG